MTDRFHSLTVVLVADMRDDDATPIIEAIAQLRGVLSVEGNVANSLESHVAEQRVRRELGTAVMSVIYPKAAP